ncbi:MAG: PhoH family protein, partial [Bacteroidia bacterium]|nr:PhoH family protein [Bacteroidia bacterium]
MSDVCEKDFHLGGVDPVDFYGVNNAHINMFKEAYPEVKIIARGTSVRAVGEPEAVAALSRVMESIMREIRRAGGIDSTRVAELLGRRDTWNTEADAPNADPYHILRGVSGHSIRARTENQKRLVEAVKENDVVFAVGPAGSGKTYTAVALAVRALRDKQVKKIVLARPAVEAGERLGFLPGDLKEKIHPYLRPLYDSLEDMIPAERLTAYMEKNVIEIAPLAYMRGRTLSHAFILLDEAQNATELQLKMLLTRLGLESKIVVTGDVTQIDLPRSQPSGLLQCLRILSNVPGIGMVHLDKN